MVAALGIATSTIWSMICKNQIVCMCQNLKPLLCASHCKAIMVWANKWLGIAAGLHANDMMLTVQIDKKWFFTQHNGGKVYLTPNEMAPLETVQHKNHIRKVMLLAAVARPRQIDRRIETWFDGKI